MMSKIRHSVPAVLIAGLLLLQVSLCIDALAQGATAGGDAKAPTADAKTAEADAKAALAAAKKLKNPVPSTKESIAAGAVTYKKYCAFCHGDDAKGEGPLAPKDSHPPDLTDAKWEHGSTDGEVFTVIQLGLGTGPKAVMKPFKAKIVEKDTWNVVNFLKSLRTPGTK